MQEREELRQLREKLKDRVSSFSGDQQKFFLKAVTLIENNSTHDETANICNRIADKSITFGAGKSELEQLWESSKVFSPAIAREQEKASQERAGEL